MEKWLPKSRKVYDLDENGERIKLPSGRWKSHKEDTVDWNDQKYCEIWRHEWEVIQNRYLEANDRPERVDSAAFCASSSFRFSPSSVIQPLRFWISCRMDFIRGLDRTGGLHRT